MLILSCLSTPQDAIDDKYKSLEEKDTEIRQVKMALRERDRDIERANQMLLTTEETIDVSFLQICFSGCILAIPVFEGYNKYIGIS